jgi:peptidoglycan LD-endopeptidase LytH
MRPSRATLVLMVVLLCGIDPTARAWWTPLREGLVRMAEVMILPYRVARLSTQRPATVLLMPVAGVKVKRIADTWGAPRPGGRIHQGQDIFARRGMAVRSATEGYVVHVGRHSLGGNAVVIIGAGGRRYYYAHLEAVAPDIRVGRHVTTETIIGVVGNTGNAVRTPPHLHFAVYTRSGPIDPLPRLRDRLSPHS